MPEESDPPKDEANPRSTVCSTAIYLKLAMQVSDRDRFNVHMGYAGKWVDLPGVPRIGDRIKWCEHWDDEVEQVYWHPSQSAVEVICVVDCDSYAEGCIEDGEVPNHDRVFGPPLHDAVDAGFEDISGNGSLNGYGCVPRR